MKTSNNNKINGFIPQTMSRAERAEWIKMFAHSYTREEGRKQYKLQNLAYLTGFTVEECKKIFSLRF